MISLADFQPLAITKINIFHQQSSFYRQIYFYFEVRHIKYNLLIRGVTAPVSVDSQKYLHKPSNFALKIFTLTSNWFQRQS